MNFPRKFSDSRNNYNWVKCIKKKRKKVGSKSCIGSSVFIHFTNTNIISNTNTNTNIDIDTDIDCKYRYKYENCYCAVWLPIGPLPTTPGSLQYFTSTV